MADQDRNPLIIPSGTPARATIRGCPQCGIADWDAFSVDGVVTRRCRRCKNEWSGGLPGLPQDPTKPSPPINPKDRPNLIWTRTKESGADLVDVMDRRPDLTQSFRKGAPIGEDDE